MRNLEVSKPLNTMQSGLGEEHEKVRSQRKQHQPVGVYEAGFPTGSQAPALVSSRAARSRSIPWQADLPFPAWGSGSPRQRVVHKAATSDVGCLTCFGEKIIYQINNFCA
jgi:hypothetical protein